jgi:hypothetical protein
VALSIPPPFDNAAYISEGLVTVGCQLIALLDGLVFLKIVACEPVKGHVYSVLTEEDLTSLRPCCIARVFLAAQCELPLMVSHLRLSRLAQLFVWA